MSPDPHAVRLKDEIAEIEDRRRTRILFLTLGALFALLLLFIVVHGAREHARLRAEEARPKTAEVALGQYLGTVSSTAVFAQGERLSYVEGAGEAEIGADAAFVRPLEYDREGRPVELPASITYWTLEEGDSRPYVIEPVVNPLTEINPTDYRQLQLGTLDPGDYGSGGPEDWGLFEQEQTNVSVTGRAGRQDGSVFLTANDRRVRLQGVEGLGSLDSLEVEWATSSGAPLSAFGRITSTPRGGDPLFVLRVTAVDPPIGPFGGAPGETPRETAPAAP